MLRTVALLLLAGVAVRWWARRHQVVTDQARIEGHIAPVTARVEAFVTAVRVDDGALVRAGDTLVLLDDRALRLQLAEREAELAAARRTLRPGSRAGLALAQLDAARGLIAATEGRDRLAAEGVARSAEGALLAADPRIAALVAGAAAARQSVGEAVLLAPIDGVVTDRQVEVGAATRVGAPLLQILPLHDLWVSADLSPAELRGVGIGDSAEIRAAPFPEHPLAGVVESLGPASVRIRLLAPADPARPLLPRMRATVRLFRSSSPPAPTEP